MDYSVQSITTSKKGLERRRARADALWGYLFILPQLVGLVAFALIPLIWVFYLSMVSWDGLGAVTFVGFQNFIDEFSPTSDFMLSLGHTIYYTLLTVPGSIIFALLAAVGLNRVRGKEIYRVLYFMPYITSSVAIGVMWLWLMNGDYGLINQLLSQWFHIHGPNWLTDSRFVIPSIAIVSIWQGLGFNTVLFLAGLQGIPTTYAEAARIDGANKVQLFFRVTLPLLSPTVFLATVLSIIGSFQVFDLTYVLTGGGPGKDSYTMVYLIYKQGFQLFQFGSASASAVLLFIIILAVTLFQFYMQRRWVYYEA